MKNFLKIFMICFSLLFISTVSYASDGEKTTKSSADFDVGTDNTVVNTIVSTPEVQCIFVAQDYGANFVLEFSERANFIKENGFTTIYKQPTTRLLVKEVEIFDYGLYGHYKYFISKRAKKGYLTIYKSDSIHSNGSIRWCFSS